jgi:hypothetical protein
VKKAGNMRLTIFFTFCVALLTLTGCQGAFDPFQRPGDWAATGAANETIAQQIANPADLISGQSVSTSNGVAASAGIDKALGANGVGTATGLQTAATPIAAASSN